MRALAVYLGRRADSLAHDLQDNDKLALRLLKAKRDIQRVRLERACVSGCPLLDSSRLENL